MPVQRSGAFTAFAVLNIITGSFLLLCAVCSGIDWPVSVNNQDLTQALKDFLNQEIPNYSIYKVGGAILAFLLGVGLIASGVGLLNMQNWARVLAMILCLVGILHHAGLSYLQLAQVNPALYRFFDRFFADRFPFHPNLNLSPKYVPPGLVGIVQWSAGAVYFLIQLVVLPLSSPIVCVPDYYDDDGSFVNRPASTDGLQDPHAASIRNPRVSKRKP